MEPTAENPSKIKTWWSDLSEFIFALWPPTAGLITGGTVAAVIAVITLLGVSIPHWVVWALIALAFFASAFNAYRKQRRVIEISKINFQWPLIFASFTLCIVLILAAITFSPVVKRLTQPDFSADQIFMGISDDVANSRNHYITFRTTIYNDGAPSVIRHWSLKISGTDKEEIIPSSIIAFENDWMTNWPSGSTNFTLTSTKDSFVGSMADVPIARGGQRSGFITFIVNDVSRKYLDSHETKYDLTFWDINMRKYDLPNISPSPPSKK